MFNLLQIIDSFVPFESEASVLTTPEIHEWVTKFISNGGVDYILQLYQTISESRDTPHVNLLLMTLLLRVLHKCLCFDISYLQWQYTVPSPILSISAELPPGIVLTSIDAYQFVPMLIRNVQKFSNDSLVEHTLSLIFGLIMASNMSIVELKSSWVAMIRNICYRNGSRLASCRMILRQCVMLILKCCDYKKEAIAMDDAYRGICLYEFIVQSVLQTLLMRTSSSDSDAPVACVYKQHVKNSSVYYLSEAYSLIAVLVTLHYRTKRHIMHCPDLACLTLLGS